MSLKEKEERRLLGAMAVICHGSDVLVVKDRAKQEQSVFSPETGWVFNEGDTLCVPAGGRSWNQWKLEETTRQTLEREICEELSPQVLLPQKRNGNEILQQTHPFVVAQLSKERVNQIGVTSVKYRFGDFNKRSQLAIEQAVQEETAYWVSMHQIVETLLDKQVNPQFFGIPCRPQLFAVAYIWHLKQKLTDKELAFTVQSENRALIRQIKSESEKLHLPIHNGSVEDSGEIAQNLSSRDYRFLTRRNRNHI